MDDDGCTQPVCHAVIRLDYKTLAIKGYAVVGGPDRPTSASTAEALGKELMLKKLKLPASQPGVSVWQGKHGVHHVGGMPAGDFGGFVAVSALAGVVIAAGSITWATTPGPSFDPWWLPATWEPAGVLGCGDAPATPASPPAVDEGRCAIPGVFEPEFTAQDATDVALWLNLTRHFEARGKFDLQTGLYTPAVGQCEPKVAEFLVYLSQRRL